MQKTKKTNKKARKGFIFYAWNMSHLGYSEQTWTEQSDSDMQVRPWTHSIYQRFVNTSKLASRCTPHSPATHCVPMCSLSQTLRLQPHKWPLSTGILDRWWCSAPFAQRYLLCTSVWSVAKHADKHTQIDGRMLTHTSNMVVVAVIHPTRGWTRIYIFINQFKPVISLL